MEVPFFTADEGSERDVPHLQPEAVPRCGDGCKHATDQRGCQPHAGQAPGEGTSVICYLLGQAFF